MFVLPSPPSAPFPDAAAMKAAALAMLPYPAYLPAPISHIAAIAERAEAHLYNFFTSVHNPTIEQVALSTQALWRVMAVRKTLHLLIFPGADKRHRRTKSDPTMTYLEHRTAELQDYLAQFQSLTRSLRKKPESTPSDAQQPEVPPPAGTPSNSSSIAENSSEAQPSFVVTPSGGSSNNSSSNSAPSSSASSASLRFNNSSSSSTAPQCPTLRSPATTIRAADRQAARLAKAADAPIVPRIPRDPHLESQTAFTAAVSTLSDSPDTPHTPDMSYSSDAAYSRSSSPKSTPSPQSENPCPLPPHPQPEEITFRNRRYTLTGAPLPTNNLPPLPQCTSPPPPG